MPSGRAQDPGAAILRRLEWARGRRAAPPPAHRPGREIAVTCANRALVFARRSPCDRAVEFELDGVQSGGRIAVMLGDEAAGIGFVASRPNSPAGPLLSSTMSGSKAAQLAP